MRYKDFSARIIFPPQFEPFQPYLSGPYIKSFLNQIGVSASVFDANIDFYKWFISPSASMGYRPSRPTDGSLLYLKQNVEEAVNILQKAPKSISEYRWAVNVLDEYLRNISPSEVKVGLTHLTVRNPYSSSDIHTYCTNPGNIFSIYFDIASDQLLGHPKVDTYLLSLVVIDQLPAAVIFANEIKKRRPHARVFAGGPLAFRLQQSLNKASQLASCFDAVLHGEAYRVLPRVFGFGDDFTGHVTPDFSDLDLDGYWSCHRVLPYLVAHGCKWGRCEFCSHHMTYSSYRESAIKDVLNDLVFLAEKYHTEYFSFSDEYLTIGQLEDLSSGIIDRGIDIRWSTFARAEAKFCNVEFVSKLYKAGCRMLMFGLESASQRVLDTMSKGTRVKDYRKILEACRESNIAVRCDFLVGFPGETDEDAAFTWQFINENRNVLDTPFSSYAVAAFEMRNGSPVSQRPVEFNIISKGLLRGDLDDQFDFQCKGMSQSSKSRWRERLIRFSKTEMSMEIITPQNKTHQLILKDLWDKKLFRIPVLSITPDTFFHLSVKLARGVELTAYNDNFHIVGHANGGELEIKVLLRRMFEAFGKHPVVLSDAYKMQSLMNEKTFAKLISFLYRNDYLIVQDLTSGEEH